MVIKTNEITVEYLNQRLISSKSIIIPILSDKFIHWSDPSASLSCVYMHFIDIDEACMIGINHFDLDEFNINELFSILNSNTNLKYIYNKSYVIDNIHGVDIETYLWFNHGVNIDPLSSYLFNIDNLYTEWYSAYPNSNNIIPISHHLQVCKELITNISKYIGTYILSQYNFIYITMYHAACSCIESTGICLDIELTEEKYNTKLPSNIVHPTSNVKTLTGRPSFKYDRISFNSMRKDDKYRNIIISRFPEGKLYEYDYDGYHVRLIASLIGYEFTLEENVHEHLGKFYFGIDHLNTEQYEESKRITFRQLYGEVETTYSYIDFFKRVEVYKSQMWELYETYGFVVTNGGRTFEASKLVEMTKGKLFSYIQQATETEQNILMLRELQTYLYPYSSKLIMYTYDAFLIDYSESDNPNLLVVIQQILEKSGYPVKVKAGLNYGEMSGVKIINNNAA